jgi:hypothetical protein
VGVLKSKATRNITSWLVGGVLLANAGVSFGAIAADAEKPAGAVAIEPWPVAVVDRPLTLRRGMVAASLTSQSYWSPGAHERSYLGPTAAFALHDRVEVGGGLPFALCWDGDSRACAGSSVVDRGYLGAAFALRRAETLNLAAGVAASIERQSAPAEHRTSLWLTGRRTWFHRVALLFSGALGIGWEHELVAPARATDRPLWQTNQTRLSWTEEVVWQVAEPLALFAYGNPYRPLGAPGDESWATRVGGGATLAIGARWLLVVDCDVENVMPVRSWQYVPDAKGCRVSAAVFHFPR